MKKHTAIWMALSLGAISPIARTQKPSSQTVPVTIDNYNRAQSDVYFALISKGGGFGKFFRNKGRKLGHIQGLPDIPRYPLDIFRNPGRVGTNLVSV